MWSRFPSWWPPGAGLKETYLSFQEYFPKLGKDPHRWGQPLAALLGAFRAQKELEIAAIGGKTP